MPNTSAALASIIRQLQAERQQHADAIAAIDEQFEQHGIAAEPRRKKRRSRGPGRPKGSGKKKAKNGRRKKKGRKVTKKKAGRKKTAKKRAAKKKHRSFSKTADQFILDLVKGSKGMTTAQINAKWRQARGGGTADNTLSKLTGEKKLKRENLKGARGSSYRAA
jgi:hypothetical protein